MVTKTKEAGWYSPVLVLHTYHQKIHSGPFGFYSNGIMEGVRLLPLSVSARAVRWSDDDHRHYMTPKWRYQPARLHGRRKRAAGPPSYYKRPPPPPFPLLEEKRREKKESDIHRAMVTTYVWHEFTTNATDHSHIHHINISVGGRRTPNQGRGAAQSRVFQC